MFPLRWKSGALLTLLVGCAVSIGAPSPTWAIAPLNLAGALEGRVSDENGRPQMGALVQLYDRQEKLVERRQTDDEGFFSFAGLLPDLYSVRVTLATFLPAVRDQISVQAGKSSLLDVAMSGLFSTIHLLPAASHGSGLVSDDWKWVLRSSSATRPVFRYLPQARSTVASSRGGRDPIFTESRGLVAFTAGDQNNAGPAGDVGTVFAFATSVLGSNQVRVLGDVGYQTAANTPSAAFRATFSRPIGSTAAPEVSVTMRQINIPRWGAFLTGTASDANRPPLRTLEVNLSDRTQVADGVELQYGVALDSVSLFDRVHYFSPYAKLCWSLGNAGTVTATYSSGNARPELGIPSSADPNADLQRNVAALSVTAPVTMREGEFHVQRGEEAEIAYSRDFGSRRVRLAAYRESVQNAALMFSGVDPASFSGNLIPDVYTDSVLFDAGNYHTTGYAATATQNLGDNYQLSLRYGSVGVLAPRFAKLTSESADELRSLIHAARREAVAVLVAGSVPHTGTHFVASYQFMDSHAATAGRLYSTDSLDPDSGLNIAVRQPMPAIAGLPFRMEATIDMRNLLAEGYLPVERADGRRMLLVHTPRSVRGGVNFRF